MLHTEKIAGGYTAGSRVLNGVDLSIKPGEVLGIVGMNGCGKSTLGKAIMNMLPWCEGKTFLGSQDLSHLPTHKIVEVGVSMMPQGGRLFLNLTVSEHFSLTMKSSFQTKSVDQLKLFTTISEFQQVFAPSFLRKKAGNLSGGEKQLVSLCMALIMKPRVLILDESTAGLSPAVLNQVTGFIEEVKKLRTVSILLIEQNINVAVKLSDRILLLDKGIIGKEFIIDRNFDPEKLSETIFN